MCVVQWFRIPIYITETPTRFNTLENTLNTLALFRGCFFDGRNTMPTEVITALISGFVTLTVAIGTWHFTAKKDRDENKKLVLTKVDELKDDISDVNARVQQQIAVIDVKIETLSQRVEKHNNVIERVYRLEEADKLLDERIKVGNHRLDDLEHKVG